MYVGRIVSVGRTPNGAWCAMYRVSSRSFPNRRAVIEGSRIRILPRPGFEEDLYKNPYIAYTCGWALDNPCALVVSNGSHTEPIAEKLLAAMSARDALTLTHLVMDYEKDAYNTPRISGVVLVERNEAWLGVVREDGIEVQRYTLEPGEYVHVATYEENHLSRTVHTGFTAQTAEEAAEFICYGGLFADRTLPITSAALMATAERIETAVCVVPAPSPKTT